MCLDREGSRMVRSGGDRGKTYRCPSSGRAACWKRDPLASGTKLGKRRRSSPDICGIRYEGLGPPTEESEWHLRGAAPCPVLASRFYQRPEPPGGKTPCLRYWPDDLSGPRHFQANIPR